eukprot:820348-Amphidinium_carterae.1
MRINQATTFDEVHQWISNFFNSTYTGIEEDKGTVGAITNYEEENYENYEVYNEYWNNVEQ